MCFQLRCLILAAVVSLVYSGFGCADEVTQSMNKDEIHLRRIVDDAIAPTFIAKLNRHLGNKNARILLYQMRNGDMEAKNDELHYFIKTRLRELLVQQGMNVFTHARQRVLINTGEHQSHYNCQPFPSADIYVGIEVKPQDFGQWRVLVSLIKAIEPNHSVANFEIPFNSSIWDYEASNWSKLYDIEGLRGLRLLPFSSDQDHLLADYLATVIACKLPDKVEGEADITFHANLPFNHNPAWAMSFADTLQHNLNRKENLVLASSHYFAIKQPRFKVVMKIHSEGIDTNLHLVSIEIIDRDDQSKVITDIAPEAFVVIEPSADVVEKPYVVASNPKRVGPEKIDANLSITCVKPEGFDICESEFERHSVDWVVELSADKRLANSYVDIEIRGQQGIQTQTTDCHLDKFGYCKVVLDSDTSRISGKFTVFAEIKGSATKLIEKDTGWTEQEFYTW